MIQRAEDHEAILMQNKTASAAIGGGIHFVVALSVVTRSGGGVVVHFVTGRVLIKWTYRRGDVRRRSSWFGLRFGFLASF